MPLTEPQTLMLWPSKRKTLLYLLLCLALTVMAAFMIATGGGAMGWVGLILFGLGALTLVVQLMPGASYLNLTPDGFIICSLFRKWPLIRWAEVSEFRVVTVPRRRKMVVFDWSRARNARLLKVSRALVGAGEGLPDTYGLKPQELSETMNHWRRNATRARGTSEGDFTLDSAGLKVPEDSSGNPG
jgi:hypothetical protein